MMPASRQLFCLKMSQNPTTNSSKSSQKLLRILQKPPEYLESAAIGFSMVFNLYGVLRTEFGTKLAKKIKNDLPISGRAQKKLNNSETKNNFEKRSIYFCRGASGAS